MKPLISTEFAYFDVQGENKEQVILALSKALFKAGRISDLPGYVRDVLARENEFSTAVGFSVATPHAKSDHVVDATAVFARLGKAILWDEEEDESVDIIFLLAIPTRDKGDRHLQILAALSRKLIHDDFRKKISQATTAQQIVDLIGDIS